MKNTNLLYLLLTVAFFSVSMIANARSWHINNQSGISADFVDINAAMSSENVVDGDTLYLGAGCVIGSQTLSKRVTLIGTGWRYNDSPVNPAKINGDITVTAAGARLLGVYVVGRCYIKASNIVVERCYVGHEIRSQSHNLNNVKVLSCWTSYIGSANYSSSGWEIRNNIVKGSYYTATVCDFYNAVVENNIIINTNSGNSILYNMDFCTIRNNIMLCGYSSSYTYNCDNNFMQGNVLSASPEYENLYPGNVLINSIDESLLFNCTGTVESGEYYTLKEGSPAIGAGEGGADCGVYGGVYRFVPYGRPQHIPVIKEAVVPSIPTDGKIKVSFKIENNNE